MRRLFHVAVAIAACFGAYSQLKVWAAHGHLANGLSLFTIQSNLLAAATLLFGIRFAMLRGAVTTYLALTGLVFGTVLDPFFWHVKLDDAILHGLVPLSLWVDWMRFPGALPLPSWTTIAIWLVYPTLFLVYSLVRGPIVHWYPYRFFDPQFAGVGLVAFAIVMIAALAIGLASVVIRRSRLAHV